MELTLPNGCRRDRSNLICGEAKHQSFATLALAEGWYSQNTLTPSSNHSAVLHFSTQTSKPQTTSVPKQAALEGVGGSPISRPSSYLTY